MPINEKFLAARAEEQRNRLITYLPFPAPLRLPLRSPAGNLIRRLRRYWHGGGGREFVLPICHFTERQLMELHLANNAFVIGLAPLVGDVQNFVWRLHPLFIRPDSELPNRRFPGGPKVYATFWQKRCALRARNQISALGTDFDLFAAEKAIRKLLEVSAQDAPAADADNLPAPACAPINHWDELQSYFTRAHGFSPSETLDHPRALLFQLFRSHLLSLPDGEMRVIDPSDALLQNE